MKSDEEWCLEDIWLKLSILEMRRDKLNFLESDVFYDMIAKCTKIINKALSVKNAKQK